MNKAFSNDRITERKYSPLYASPWMALFLMIRRELAQPRARS